MSCGCWWLSRERGTLEQLCMHLLCSHCCQVQQLLHVMCILAGVPSQYSSRSVTTRHSCHFAHDMQKPLDLTAVCRQLTKGEHRQKHSTGAGHTHTPRSLTCPARLAPLQAKDSMACSTQSSKRCGASTTSVSEVCVLIVRDTVSSSTCHRLHPRCQQRHHCEPLTLC